MARHFSFPVFKLEVKSNFRSALIWGGVLSGVMLLIMAFFPSMQNEAMRDLAGAKLSGIPESVLAILGLSRDALDLTDVFFFFSYVMQYINMALAVFAALMGTSALIKEETDGTIEYLFSRPITRTQILCSKYLATFTVLVALKLVLVLAAAIAFLIFASGTNWGTAFKNIITTFSGTLFAETVFLSIGFFCSVMIKSAKRTSSIAIGLVFGTFLVGIMSILSNELKFLLYFSPLDTVKPNLLIKGGVDFGGFLVGICVIITAFTLSVVLYRKKDFLI